MVKINAAINATLDRLGKPALTEAEYWSSTEDNGNGVWKLDMGTDTVSIATEHQDFGYYVRPVIAYGPKAGDILYSDGTVSSDALTGKTPIGVVFDPDKKLAVALETKSSQPFAEWGVDVPNLENCTEPLPCEKDDNGNGKNCIPPLSCGKDGKANTAAIMADAKANSRYYQGAEVCYNYTTSRTKAGDWFLPSMNELNTIFLNKNEINRAMSKIRIHFGFSALNLNTTKFALSSTEYGAKHVWVLTNNDTGYSFGFENKDLANFILPVINYEGQADTQPTCEDGGYLDTQPDKQTCTPISYQGKKCYTDCQATTPLPILYSDMTVDNRIIPGKTLIGIVFDTNKRLAMAVQYFVDLPWGSNGGDIPSLINCSLEPLSCGTNGKANTETIVAYKQATHKSHPAAEYCYHYTTEGTNIGDWFLPSYVELKSIYNAKSMIDATLEMLGKSSIPTNWYWSSTEGDGGYSAWGVSMYNGGSSPGGKGLYHNAQPVIQY